MKFPGGKLIHEWDLALQRISLDDVLRSSRDVGLTGFAELQLTSGAGMILWYLGTVASVIYREGPIGYNGHEALEALRTAMAGAEGHIQVHELPLEMAHLMRGVTNRHRLPGSVRTPADLEAVLEDLKRREHTGMLEVQAAPGAAVVLFVNGRISNMYWDGGDARTLEQGGAFVALQQALQGQEAPVFLSTFSRETWKSRHEEEPARPATQEGAPAGRALDDLEAQIPALRQVMIVDLPTGAVLARRNRGTAALKSALFADKVPALAQHLRGLVASAREDDLEVVELTSRQFLTVIAAIPEIQEVLAVVADRSQPTAHIAAIVGRVARTYGASQARARHTGLRGPAAAPPLH